MASILIAGLLTLVLGFAIGWLAAWVASLRFSRATLSTLWGRVLLGSGVLAAVLVALLASPLVNLPSRLGDVTPTDVVPTETSAAATPVAATPVAAYPTSTP